MYKKSKIILSFRLIRVIYILSPQQAPSSHLDDWLYKIIAHEELCENSLSHDQLCDMFEMGKNDKVSKMMINRDLVDRRDQPAGTIVMRKAEPSPLQVLAWAVRR